MPSTDTLEATPRKDLNIFYILDTSGSMAGEKISALNHAMEECNEALKDLAKSNADANLKIAVMSFDSGFRWVTSNGPENIEDFEWEYLEPGGLTEMGEALKELNDKLSRSGFLNSMTGALMPVIIFMTDGWASDEYAASLEAIRQNKWYKRATKIGFAIGDEADVNMIANIVGNPEAVIETTDLDLFKRLIKFVSVSSSMLVSKSQTTSTDTSGATVIKDMINNDDSVPDDIVAKEAQITIPDTSSDDSSSDDDWGDDDW